ncbi:MAG: 16S rRNA (guanine(966)-N(2))-methyltransferase RsmD [Spirochaetes bacterium]|nr:16S rRNA (guanine(966)-N(2))-methyltransferase RsmD [Spirochaetota bacterium]
MYIIAGTYKGRRLSIPKYEFRPTQGKAKEALFSMVNVARMDVLDLFAGSGAIGFEAISRGAASVVCVDIESRAVNAMSDTAEKIGMQNIRFIRDDVLRFLSRGATPFDLIYADPPYSEGRYAEVLAAARNGWLAEQGIIVLEMSKHELKQIKEEPWRVRHYGKTYLVMFRKGSQEKTPPVCENNPAVV